MKLRACPFCGCPDVRLIANEDLRNCAYVMCHKCHASTSIFGGLSPKDAVRVWNKRASDAK